MIAPVYERAGIAALYLGDCVAVMGELPEASVDAVVTDPPYGLEFMGKEWDTLWATRPKASPFVAHAVNEYRAGAAAQRWHEAWARAAVRVLKPGGHLLAFGGTRTFHRLTCALEDAGLDVRDCLMWLYGTGFPKSRAALKPAWEPVVLARKPLVEANVEANVGAHGTGTLNLDACRITTADDYTSNAVTQGINGRGTSYALRRERRTFRPSPAGRWPANLMLDEAAAAMLDAQSGTTASYGGQTRPFTTSGFEDSGGASRFFYTSKADGEDRDGSRHPTVKPVDLMKWLIRLVTPEGGVVLDPFAGSGTTIFAARALGIRSIGIEREAAYLHEAIFRLRQEVLPL